MTGGKPARAPRGRLGPALASAFAPDKSADADMDRLIEQLGSLPWPKEGDSCTPST